MPFSKLPDKNSPEGQELAQEYKSALEQGDIARLEGLSQMCGYGKRSSFYKAMDVRYGIKFGGFQGQLGLIKEQEALVINLPPIKLREYKGKKVRRGDEETAVLIAGDGHAGKITPNYDEDVYLESMDTIFDSVMTIVTLHRHMYPINTLRIPILGDNVQGENPRQGSRIGAVKIGARDQIAKLAFPAWVKLICSLKQEFAEVIVDGFPGNHGHCSFDAPETSSWDLILYDQLQAKLGGKKGITINIHEDFGDIIEIMGFRFFCFHGDEVPCQQGVPFFALTKKLKSWYMEYGGFNYALCGHFHKRMSDELATGIEYFMTGTLVVRDTWALKKLGISSKPTQWLLGVHPKMGVTWRYGLMVNRQFLIERMPDVYGKKE